VLARLREAAYRRRHPDHPWLTRDAISTLDGLLEPSWRGLEFGSGRGTLWLARRVAALTSVEHDPGWHGRVRGLLDESGTANVDLRLVETSDDDPRRAASPYVQVAHEFADGSLDLVLVDGILREHCVLAALPKLRAGGVLVLDNANWYLPCGSHAPGSIGRDAAPASPLWSEVERRLGGWRRLWTANGVFDTALWIRPEDAA
jgi:predicted O-methyltransferase YrrM